MYSVYGIYMLCDPETFRRKLFLPAQIPQLHPFHQIFFNVFKRNTAGLRNKQNDCSYRNH